MRSALVMVLAAAASAQTMRLPLRSRSQGEPITTTREVPVNRTAIVICDMWDKHWCSGATRRVGVLVKEMEPVLQRARASGIQIIHAPSETMDFYKDYPQRQAMLRLAKVEPPAPLDHADPPLPIDDKSGGCDTHETFYTAWTREHPGLSIGPQDRISDSGPEIYSLLHSKGIDTILVMGVHTNMCVLKRSFAIKQMTKWGLKCVLVRDLTDSMYDPLDRPQVPHAQGTNLVIEFIERYWAPSVTSTELLQSLTSLR